MKKTLRPILAIAFLAVAVLVITSCGDDDDSNGDSGASKASACDDAAVCAKLIKCCANFGDDNCMDKCTNAESKWDTEVVFGGKTRKQLTNRTFPEAVAHILSGNCETVNDGGYCKM